MVAVVADRQVDNRETPALQLRSYRYGLGDVPRGMRKPVRKDTRKELSAIQHRHNTNRKSN
jgi:hypothetical protein